MLAMMRLFGAAFFGSAFALAVSLCNAEAATHFKILHSFTGAEGTWPQNFIVDRVGNIVGTAEVGGPNGNGAIFKLWPDGTYTVLHAFSRTDGFLPGGFRYIQHSGRIFGTTTYGGRDGCHHAGCGVLYSLKADGTFAVLHRFRKNDEGSQPSGPVPSGPAGLYGVSGGDGPNGLGTIWTLQGRHLTVLHAFENSGDGGEPIGGLLKGLDGNFYGTTVLGGEGHGVSVAGLIYRFTPDGTVTTLHKLVYLTDGSSPRGLIQDRAGNLYGSTWGGGPGDGGTVFKMTPDGTFSVIHSFDRGKGGNLPGKLLLIDNVLYGSTQLGGDLDCNSGNGCGVVFKLAMDGTETVLHTFKGGAIDGAIGGELRKGPHGLLYGCTLIGGSANQGILFQMKR
jgi:uncharacterized repeat protein (TIGR03803 family)